jgi:hypothetical protein
MPRMTVRIFTALSEPVLPWLATLTAHIVRIPSAEEHGTDAPGIGAYAVFASAQ